MNFAFLKRDIPRKRAVLTVVALVTVASVVAGRERPALELVHERAPRAVVVEDDGIDLDKLRRGESSLPQNDPFARMKGVEKQAAPAPQAAARPVAPPLPFRYFGRLTENGKTEVYVMRGDELISIAPGQTIGEYRVDQVAQSSIGFTYLPLKTKQTLDVQ